MTFLGWTWRSVRVRFVRDQLISDQVSVSTVRSLRRVREGSSGLERGCGMRACRRASAAEGNLWWYGGVVFWLYL